MASCSRALLGTIVAVAAASAASAQDLRALDNCVGPTRIEFAADDLRALLDASERVAVQAQLAQRYPVLQRDGLAPEQILLWRQPATGAWLYLALQRHPRRESDWCYSASFVARGVDLTATLLRKYFALQSA